MVAKKDPNNFMRTVAFRNEVSYQTRRFRYESGFEANGKWFHVGHVGPEEFKDLLARFLREQGMLLENIKVSKQTHEAYDITLVDQPFLLDRDLAYKWKDFHQENAQLQIQSAFENMAPDRFKFYKGLVEKVWPCLNLNGFTLSTISKKDYCIIVHDFCRREHILLTPRRIRTRKFHCEKNIIDRPIPSGVRSILFPDVIGW